MPRSRLSRPSSFAVVGGVYLVAIVAGVVAAERWVGTGEPLLYVGVADLVATAVVLAGSVATDNSSMYDAYWSVVPPLIALFHLSVADPGMPTLRQGVVVALVWAWGIRLTANWARGWPGLSHEDWRYAAVRETKVPYWVQSAAGFHLFPTIVVYLGCLPLRPAIGTGVRGFGVMDVVAAGVTGGALLGEFVADEQLRAFNRTKEPGEICAVGVWGWCRHPNYLGEMGVWWGLWLFALAADPGWWWTVLGPAAITVMFLGASIPMIDRRSVERRPGYAEHMARVPAVLPRPPRR